VPTKRRRHAITETPPVQEALDELRAELRADRIDLSELVILGAREKLAQARAADGRKKELRRRLADRIRNGQMIPLDLEAAEYVKRHGWADREPAP
jgi:hypothetical protein